MGTGMGGRVCTGRTIAQVSAGVAESPWKGGERTKKKE